MFNKNPMNLNPMYTLQIYLEPIVPGLLQIPVVYGLAPYVCDLFFVFFTFAI